MAIAALVGTFVVATPASAAPAIPKQEYTDVPGAHADSVAEFEEAASSVSVMPELGKRPAAGTFEIVLGGEKQPLRSNQNRCQRRPRRPPTLQPQPQPQPQPRLLRRRSRLPLRHRRPWSRSRPPSRP